MNALKHFGDSSMMVSDEIVDGTLEEDPVFYFVDVIFLVSPWTFHRIFNSTRLLG